MIGAIDKHSLILLGSGVLAWFWVKNDADKKKVFFWIAIPLLAYMLITKGVNPITNQLKKVI